jgi:hypothetical protein
MVNVDHGHGQGLHEALSLIRLKVLTENDKPQSG